MIFFSKNLGAIVEQGSHSRVKNIKKFLFIKRYNNIYKVLNQHFLANLKEELEVIKNIPKNLSRDWQIIIKPYNPKLLDLYVGWILYFEAHWIYDVKLQRKRTNGILKFAWKLLIINLFMDLFPLTHESARKKKLSISENVH